MLAGSEDPGPHVQGCVCRGPEVCRMPDSFGARLRERRERQQVTLGTIADQTKIKVSLLEALERDDVSHWPSGIFRRAFIRAYAHAIGLEPDVVVREFLDLYPDPVELVSALPVGPDNGRATDGAPTRLSYLVASAIGSVSRLRARSHQRSELLVDASAGLARMPIESDPIPDVPAVPSEAESFLPLDTAAAPSGKTSSDAFVPADSIPAVPSDPLPTANVLPSMPIATVPPVEPMLSVPPPLDDSPEPDLLAVAHLCTELGRVQGPADVPPLLREITQVLDAIGLIVWLWDPIASELRPTLAHGYSDRVVAQLPRVERDTNNATAAAFRAAQTCVVNGDDVDNGALAVPLMGPAGCVGVLAIELAERREEKESVRAHAMIFAAQLTTLIGTAQPMEASDRRLA